MAMQHLKRQRLDLDSRVGILHCHCLQPAKRMVSKTDNQVFWICSKSKPEQCDFFQLEGQQVGDKPLTLEMAELDGTEVMESAEKEGLAHAQEDGNLMLGEMGDEHDPSVLRDFDIPEKGLLPSITYLSTTSTTSSSGVSQAEAANLQATAQEQTQQIQEHQQNPQQVPPEYEHAHLVTH